MNELISLRLKSQKLSNHEPIGISGVVRNLVGIQAQIERNAHWSIGIRRKNCTEQEVIEAVERREILRTWLFRGTLHFVAREDLLWLLGLLGPRIIQSNARRYAQLGLNNDVFSKNREVIRKVLESQGAAARSELKSEFQRAGMPAQGQQVPYLLQRAALERFIYISGMHGRDMVFRQISELGLPGEDLDYPAALARLVNRYFRGHGPASVHDFAWWSGLPVGESRMAIDTCVNLKEMGLDGRQYYSFEQEREENIDNQAYLLPPFDEYLLGYQNRDLVLAKKDAGLVNRGGGMLKPIFLINGRVAGIWKMDEKKNLINLKIFPFQKISVQEQELMDAAIRKLGLFFQKPVYKIT